jgi:hypothetical protein
VPRHYSRSWRVCFVSMALNARHELEVVRLYHVLITFEKRVQSVLNSTRVWCVPSCEGAVTLGGG